MASSREQVHLGLLYFRNQGTMFQWCNEWGKGGGMVLAKKEYKLGQEQQELNWISALSVL